MANTIEPEHVQCALAVQFWHNHCGPGGLSKAFTACPQCARGLACFANDRAELMIDDTNMWVHRYGHVLDSLPRPSDLDRRRGGREYDGLRALCEVAALFRDLEY